MKNWLANERFDAYEIANNHPGAPRSATRFRQSILALAVVAAVNAQAQTVPETAGKKDAQKLKPVVVQDQAEAQLGKDSVRAVNTTSAKGNQPLRDIPQSITVVTEKLINDRHLDTVREALSNTAGVTFLAAEGGEEDIRLRGFSLATTGDIFLDGMRDAAFYDRDTFNLDRLDLLRGSASMLFGRGSTGGVANQVSKTPHLVEDHSVTLSIGSHNYSRLVADINQPVAENTAARLTLMRTEAANNGSGGSLDKQGAALAIHHNIGFRNEFQAKVYYLDNNNGMNYGLPWIRPTSTSTSADNTIIPGLKPDAYYGAASDYNAGSAKIATLGHVFRASVDTEIKSQLRVADYARDQRASAIRFVGGNANVANTLAGFGPLTPLSRGSNNKIQDLETVQVQSDLSSKFSALGFKHFVLAGVDYAKDEKVVYAARSLAQGGVTLIKTGTFAGTPSDGTGGVDEGSRVLRPGNDFNAKALGIYFQDNIDIFKDVKLVLGLRYDNLDGKYNIYAIPNNAPGPVTTTNFKQEISEWSHRVGMLYQPSDLHSFHFSYGTSFNTSGDTYSYNALSANTPPESSENIEFGGRIESADKRLSTRFALFRSTKKNERNTDPDTAATRLLLSGKRHVSGLEIDVAGKITNAWEIYLSYIWIPTAKVDVAAGSNLTVGNRVGDRPGLTPKHAGTVFTTYQVTPKIRLGGGLSYRDKQAPADVTAPPWEAPAFVTGDLFAEYKFDRTWNFKLNVSNVADKYYGDSLYRGHYIPGAGRLVQGTVVVSF